MDKRACLERFTEIQDEIIRFTWDQVCEKVDKFYVQGKVTDETEGWVPYVEGAILFAVVGDKVLKNSEVMTSEELDDNVDFVRPRIVQLHDLSVELQGKSAARFRWCVDVVNDRAELDMTYYHDLTDEDRENNFWMSWQGDLAWKAQLEAELAENEAPGC